MAFNIGPVVYDALLVDVSTPDNRGRISGLGVGVGYIGSFVGLGIGLVTLEVLGWSYSATFRALATRLPRVRPACFLLHPGAGRAIDEAPLPRLAGIVAARMAASWRLAAGYRAWCRFLVGRFLYTDAINTLIGGFLTIFVIEELGVRPQLRRPAAPRRRSSPPSSARSSRGGCGTVWARSAFSAAVLVLWMVAIASGIAAAVTGEIGLAWAIGAAWRAALGATWTADRVVMTRSLPPRHLGEFYGLYATVGRFATILGPLTWALIVNVLGLGRRLAMGALIGFIVIGWWVLRRWMTRSATGPRTDLPVISDKPCAPLK